MTRFRGFRSSRAGTSSPPIASSSARSPRRKAIRTTTSMTAWQSSPGGQHRFGTSPRDSRTDFSGQETLKIGSAGVGTLEPFQALHPRPSGSREKHPSRLGCRTGYAVSARHAAGSVKGFTLTRRLVAVSGLVAVPEALKICSMFHEPAVVRGLAYARTSIAARPWREGTLTRRPTPISLAGLRVGSVVTRAGVVASDTTDMPISQQTVSGVSLGAMVGRRRRQA